MINNFGLSKFRPHRYIGRYINRPTVIGLVILIWGLIFPLTVIGGGDWALVADDDGLRLYSRLHTDNAQREFKGVSVVDHPIEAVGSVLSDIAAYPKWFFRCLQAQKIPTKDASDYNFLLYVVIDTPWPFSDRDAVYRAVTSIDCTAGKIVVRIKAIKTHLMAERKAYVRITDSDLQWILERLTPRQTRITFINRTHAAGPWGDIISGSGTRATTLHSLKNLKIQLRQTHSHRGTSKTGHGAFSRIVIPI